MKRLNWRPAAFTSTVCLVACLALFTAPPPVEAQTWVSASHGRYPANAYVGGQEPGRSLVICRASHGNFGVHPGKVVGRHCNFGYGGKEILRANYEVLLDDGDFEWIAGPQIPADAVRGGQEPRRSLYVCRANYRNGTHPGKVVAGQCNIGWGGREIELRSFEILVKRPAQRDDVVWRRVVTYEDIQRLYMRARQSSECRAIRGVIDQLQRFYQEHSRVPSDKAYSVRYGNPSNPPTIGDLAEDRALRIKSIKRSCF